MNSNKPRKNSIIGCTNPLLFSACRHWPHIFLNLGGTNNQDASVFGTTSKVKGSSSFRAASESHRSGLFSDRRRSIKRDPDIVDAAQSAIKRGDYSTADSILLRHFSSISERMLVPLNRYFASLQPIAMWVYIQSFGRQRLSFSSSSTSDLLSTPTQVQPFNALKFMEHLAEHDTPLLFRRSRIPSSSLSLGTTSPSTQFYKTWLSSPSFAAWLHTRVEVTDRVSQSRYLASLREWLYPGLILCWVAHSQLRRRRILQKQQLAAGRTVGEERWGSHVFFGIIPSVAQYLLIVYEGCPQRVFNITSKERPQIAITEASF